MLPFVNWIFNLFPNYFWENDTYKDADGLGLLQRFIHALAEEWDEQLMGRILNVRDLSDPLIVDEKFLVHLSDVLGNPPDTFYDIPSYRRMLRYITQINKWKGTAKSYEMIFAILGVSVVITEIAPSIYRYDMGWKHDDKANYPELKYDNGKCPACSYYTLAISDPNGNCPILADAATDPSVHALLMAIIKYVEPINAKLSGITYEGGEINAIPWVLTTGIWDDDRFWKDTGIWRDEPDAIEEDPWQITNQQLLNNQD